MSDQAGTIDRPNLNELVAEHIKRQIFEGALGPGEKIGEDDVAKSMGTSRTPVKIALSELAKEGLVELIPRRGAFVRKFSHNDIIELSEIRRAFEGLAGRLSARYIEPGRLDRLEELNNTYGDCVVQLADPNVSCDETVRRTKELDLAFHRTILESTGNRHLAMLMGLNSIGFLSFLYEQPIDPISTVKRTKAEHEEIIEALRARKENLAEQLLQRHIMRAIEVLEESDHDE